MHALSIQKPNPDRPKDVQVNIVVGAAVIVQTALALMWTGAASERLTQLERHAEVTGSMVERTARLDEQMQHATAALIRIERKIDRQLESVRDE